MSIDFYWLVELININQLIVIDYYWLYWLVINDWFSLIDTAGFIAMLNKGATSFYFTDKYYIPDFYQSNRL